MVQNPTICPTRAVAPYRSPGDTDTLTNAKEIAPKLLDLQMAVQVGVEKNGPVANILELRAQSDITARQLIGDARTLIVEPLAQARFAAEETGAKPEAHDKRAALGKVSAIIDAMGTLFEGEPTFDRATRYVALYRQAVSVYKKDQLHQPEIMAALRGAYAAQSEVKAILDAPYLCADGLMRTSVSVPLPHVLEKMRQKQGLDPNRCKFFVVGAGQAGIACAAAAGFSGVDTVVADRNFRLSAFSQGGAPSVKLLRSGLGGSTAARDAVSPELVAKKGKIVNFLQPTEPVELPPEADAEAVRSDKFMKPYNLRAVAADAREHSGDPARTDPGLALPKALTSDEKAHPGIVARAEYVGVMQEMADSATAQPGVFILEQVTDLAVTFDPDRDVFTITSADGYRIEAEYLGVATGMTGPAGENARTLPELTEFAAAHPGRLLLAPSTDHLVKVAGELEHPAVAGNQQLVLPDGLLGQAVVEAHFATLAPGTTVAVIGSGEGAAKAAVEVALANPHLIVNVFTQGALLPCQPDTPNFTITPNDAVVRVQVDAELGARSLELVAKHPTTVTPETMLKLLELAGQNRVKLFELGEKFGADSVTLTDSDDGSGIVIKVAPVAANVEAALTAQQAEFAAHGIAAPDPRELISGVTITGPFILGLGHDRANRLKSPLIKSLLAQGLLEVGADGKEFVLDPENNLTSSLSPKVIPIGAFNRTAFSSSTISGCAVGAGRAVDWVANGGAESKKFVDMRSLPKPPVPTSVTEIPSNDTITDPAKRFLGVNPTLHRLAATPADKLKPIEALVLSRGDRVQRLAVQLGEASGIASR